MHVAVQLGCKGGRPPQVLQDICMSGSVQNNDARFRVMSTWAFGCPQCSLHPHVHPCMGCLVCHGGAHAVGAVGAVNCCGAYIVV